MHRAMLAVIATLLIAASVIPAQTSVPVNSRVRVTVRNGEQVTGKLTEARGDTLVVIDDGVLFDSEYRIPADGLRRVEVSRGKSVHPGRVIGGAVLGAVAGFIAGMLIPSTECSGDVCGTGPAFPAAIAVGVAGGVMLGVLTPADRWEPVPPPVRVGFGGDGRHARVGLSIAF